MADTELLDQFVASFQKFHELLADDSIPPELDGGIDDSCWARQRWRPARIPTEADALDSVYKKVPARLPPLLEQLILTYRWLEVELGNIVILLPNPPGPTLHAFTDSITADPLLCSVLFPLGLIPFGKVCGGHYDQLCFDTRSRHVDGDCPVVRVEHESVLCNGKLGETWQVTPTFRLLVESVISQGNELTAN